MSRLERFLPLDLTWSLVFAMLSVAAVLPLFQVVHPPLQDLPQHLAAISVLRHYPELNLGEYFELSFGRTQYLAYYGAAYLLSFPFGVVLANKLLLASALVAMPWTLASLLKALGRDSRAAVFAFGLTYNAHLVLGFFNFIAALPLMFAGLGLAVRMRLGVVDARIEKRRGVLLAVLLVLCFYTHVVPFAFLALGAALLLWGDGLRATLRRALVFVPAGVAFAAWLAFTPAGGSTLAAAGGAEGRARATFASVPQAMRELPMWLTDVLTSERDEHLWVAWLALLACAVVFALREPGGASEADGLRRELSFRVSLLAPFALAAYFVAPTGYDWIWPISARFPLLALLFASLLVPPLRGVSGQALFAAAGLVAWLGFSEVGRAFEQFEREEVGDLERALELIPEGERVSGLIFSRGSRHVKFAPFIHYVSYYQVRKGGAVMFTFADFPQSPFRFREALRPPRVPPRWEWQPERVDPGRDLAWYRYVLVRGGPGHIGRHPDWKRVFTSSHWQLFQHR